MSTENKSYGAGSGKGRHYAIEVRTSYHEPEVVGDFVITKEWRRLPIAITHLPIGIPAHNYCFVADRLDLMTYESAYALAATFVRHCQFGGGCVQFRLVEIEITYEFSTKELGVGDSVSLSDLSRNAKFIPREPQP